MRVPFVLALGLVAAVTPLAVSAPSPAHAAGERVPLGIALSPDPRLSTSGDYATDTFGDPWDFSNQEDVWPISELGLTGVPQSEIVLGAGVLSAATTEGDAVRLLMEAPGVLPWGHDGWAHPIDANRYTQTSLRIYSDRPITMAIRFWTVSNTFRDHPDGLAFFDVKGGEWQVISANLLDRRIYRNGGVAAAWSGPITRFDLVHERGISDSANIQLDWVRLHRADAPAQPPAQVPITRILTPSIQGGGDYATDVRGNAWDFEGMDDIGRLVQLDGARIEGGDLVGTSTGNDSSIQLALGAAIDTNRYHRLTVDVCYDGTFGLSGNPGGGMNGRLYWGDGPEPDALSRISQDFVVFPGCQVISIDLATSPPTAVDDEGSGTSVGWRGQTLSHFRFDFHEDPGARNIRLRSIRLAEDAAFSTTYPITFADASGAGGTADIYVSSTEGSYTGTKIASVPVAAGTNTFTWNGTDAAGKRWANGKYWVWISIGKAAGVGTAFASGPLRIQRPILDTPSYYVPLTPARLLDTRTGEGGYSAPLGAGGVAELDVYGVGGLPAADITAVVMNVTVDSPTTAGFLTAWPSAEPRPLVSNLNFVPGQTVPNLVTVKIGANGKVDLFNSGGSTHVIADIAGYYTATPQNTGKFTAVTPARVLDTRDGVGRGGSAGPVGSGVAIDLDVTGVGGVPADVSSVALNVTVDQPTASGFLTVYPTSEPRPNASTHNFVPGLTVANMVIAKVGAGGMVSIFNSSGGTHVVADVVGYFSASGGLFVPIAPRRIVDSREGLGLTTMVGGEPRSMPVATSNPVPAAAKAVVVNVTSVNSSIPSFVTVWPGGSAMPLASTLNPRPGVPVPNQAYLRLGSGGSLGAFNASGTTDVIVDVFGYIM